MDTQKVTDELKEQNNANDIPLRIISIPDKEWKEYRNQAPQDELLVLGIGMKLWLGKTRKSALFFTLGLLLSIIIGAIVAIFVYDIAGIIIIGLGYLIFSTICMRRRLIKTSLSQTRSKLSVDNRKALDAEFKTSGGASVAEAFTTIVLLILCQPYVMALAVISAVIPSVLNTKLVIPEGFGFEALEEVKGYYAEKSFLSEAINICFDNNSSNTKSTKTFKDEYGNDVDVEEQTYVINDRGEKVYKDKFGNEYVSDDGGKTANKKQ